MTTRSQLKISGKSLKMLFQAVIMCMKSVDLKFQYSFPGKFFF